MPQLPNERHFSSDHFINRELSLLQFQRRVLAQAADPSVPLTAFPVHRVEQP